MIAQNADTQSEMNPAKALQALKDGNQRFVAGKRGERDLLGQVNATRAGQWPFAVVLSCIDSRASAELILDQGIGDIFSVRIAGNFVNEDILGSMEFGCKVAGSKVLVVLGHRHCGAVKGACDGVELGNLTAMLAKIQPAVDGTPEPAAADQRTSANLKFVDAVARRNVELTMTAIRERSPILAEMEKGGEIEIVGAMYDVETGAVEFWT